MICYLIRHGKDDETVRGGWSQAPLTDEGVKQAEALAKQISDNRTAYSIAAIFSSDLARAKETAKPIAKALDLSVTYIPEFREVNNGVLAGMKNELALQLYPNLFWNRLEWEQKYPEGESPSEFYNRIIVAWHDFEKDIVKNNKNVILVTHSGVIQVILSIISNMPYSNKAKLWSINDAEVIAVKYEFGKWRVYNESRICNSSLF